MKHQLIASLGILSATATAAPDRPNILLILVDDMGYECLTSTGALSYQTPNIDRLADQGVRFTQCYAQPLSTPTRTKIMTGLNNSTNYQLFEYLNIENRTFGNVMQDAGYATAIVGKWQLNGIAYNLPQCGNAMRPRTMGFDEHCLWQLTKLKEYGERFANPLIDTNGSELRHGIDAYGPDIFRDYCIDFIRRHKDQPFFLYYPMTLVHDPFYPTPDSPEWADPALREKGDPRFYVDMVNYMDKIVGQLLQTLEQEGIADNTLVIFLTDNGSGPQIISHTTSGDIRGGKGKTIMHAHRSPLIVRWPGVVEPGRRYEHLVSVADIFPTLAELVGDSSPCDGTSILPVINGSDEAVHDAITIHYDSRWFGNRAQYAMTTEYKLYATGEFFHYSEDIYEKAPLDPHVLTLEERRIYNLLQRKIDELPRWDATMHGGRLNDAEMKQLLESGTFN